MLESCTTRRFKLRQLRGETLVCGMAVVALAAAVASCSCRAVVQDQNVKPDPVLSGAADKDEVQEEVTPVPPAVRFTDEQVDEDRWLWVVEVRKDKPGAWATGQFDQDKNKIIIDTEQVQEFTIDTGKLGIDWERLVILRLDRKNSELRRRDFDLLHFYRDPHNTWIVREPDRQ